MKDKRTEKLFQTKKTYKENVIRDHVLDPESETKLLQRILLGQLAKFKCGLRSSR